MAEEAKEIKINDFCLYPFAKIEDAYRELYEVQEHFDERFKIRIAGRGYVLTSDREVIDASGFVVDRDSPLEKGKDSFRKILEFPLYTHNSS